MTVLWLLPSPFHLHISYLYRKQIESWSAKPTGLDAYILSAFVIKRGVGVGVGGKNTYYYTI